MRAITRLIPGRARGYLSVASMFLPANDFKLGDLRPGRLAGWMLVARLGQEFDRRLVSVGDRRDHQFAAMKEMLSFLGLSSAFTFYFDGGQIIRPIGISNKEVSKEVIAFARSDAQIMYKNGLMLIRVKISKDEQFIFSAKGSDLLPGREETLLAAGSMLREKIERNMLYYVQVNRGVQSNKMLGSLLRISSQFDAELARVIDDGDSEKEVYIISRIMEKIITFLPRLQTASIALWDSEAEELRAASFIGIKQKDLEEAGGKEKPFGIAKQVLLQLKRPFCRGAQIGTENGLDYDPKRLGDFLVIPFYADRDKRVPFGVICVSSKETRQITLVQRQMLELLATILSSKIAITRLINALDWARKHDGLTGLFNRIAGMEELEKKHSEARSSQKPLSALMLDLDQFSDVNNRFGHKEGDLALIQLARIMEEVAKDVSTLLGRSVPPGIVFRYGGEEFVVVLPEQDEAAAVLTAQNLRQRIECHKFDIGFGRELDKTTSIGVATLSDTMANGEDLIIAADKACQLGAKQRRNCVAVFERFENQTTPISRILDNPKEDLF